MTIPSNLSPREREVLDLIIEGMDVEEISEHLGISHWTVRDHVRGLRKKFGVERMRDLPKAVMNES